MQRILFIDQLKALSIFLIVFGHNGDTSGFSQYLTTFRLPLFFILSGYLTHDKHSLPLLPFIKKISYRLLLPYFIISLFLFLFYVFVTKNIQLNPDNLDTSKLFLGIFYAHGGEEYMKWGQPMWFLPALFCVMLIDYFVSRFKFWHRILFALLLPMTGVLLFNILGFQLPWSLGNAMIFYFFFFFGTLIKRLNFLKFIEGKELIIFSLFFVIHLVGALINMPVLYYSSQWGNVPLMLLNGVTGFIWIFSLFKMLPAFSPIIWVGRNTLPILAFHMLALTLLQGISYFVFSYILEFTLALSLTYSVLQIILLIPLIFFLNRYFPLAVGRKRISLNNPDTRD